MKKTKLFILISIVVVLVLISSGVFYYQRSEANFEEKVKNDSTYFLDCEYCTEIPPGAYSRSVRKKYFFREKTRDDIIEDLKDNSFKPIDSETLIACTLTEETVPFYQDIGIITEEVLGVNVKYVEVDSRLFDLLKDGFCDVSFGWTKTPERAREVDFTEAVYLGESIVVSPQAEKGVLENLNIIIEQILDFKAKTNA